MTNVTCTRPLPLPVPILWPYALPCVVPESFRTVVDAYVNGDSTLGICQFLNQIISRSHGSCIYQGSIRPKNGHFSLYKSLYMTVNIINILSYQQLFQQFYYYNNLLFSLFVVNIQYKRSTL